MNITHIQLLHGCLLSSIAHAIMTNEYPELAYEQSWDGNNFSAQDGCGLRGTITFVDNACVGAIRNEHKKAIQGYDAIKVCMSDFPDMLQLTAEQEALQYLFVDYKNQYVPAVTSLFWCDDDGLHISRDCAEAFQNDISLFESCCLPVDLEIQALSDYYNMNSNARRLLYDLWEKKKDCFSQEIFLSKDQKAMIPGSQIHIACKESLSELNILV